MKKFVSILLAVAMLYTLLAGCSSSQPNATNEVPNNTPTAGPTESNQDDPGTDVTFEPMKVGVAIMSSTEAMQIAQDYLDNVVGPLLNMEFIYSEVISDAGALTTFIENAKAAGAEGIINMLPNMIEQAASTCEDLGMWEVDNASATYESVEALPHHLGLIGASPAGNGKVFGEAIQNALDADEEANVLVLSGAACYGATSQIEGTIGVLNTLKDIYGLTYSQDVTALATTNAATDVGTGTAMKVTIYPGVPAGADYASAVSSLLQTGDYNAVISVFDGYGAISVAIDEVEKALGMNIKVITQMSVNESALNNLEATDSTGDNCINAGVSGELTPPLVFCAIMLRNAYDGYGETMRTDGKASVLLQYPLAISNAHDMEQLMQVPPSYLTEEEIMSLVVKANSSCTLNDFSSLMDSLTTENILAKFAS